MENLVPTFNSSSAIWTSVDSERAGLEHTWFQDFSATGTILRTDEDLKPFQVSYFYEWNDAFEIIKASFVVINDKGKKALQLFWQDKWTSNEGELPGFENCRDIDLWPSPLTNSFAIKRLNLEVNEKREIDVLWISAPSMRIELMRQSYTRLENDIYLFEDLSSDFKSKIQFDRDGLVTTYPELFQRQKSF